MSVMDPVNIVVSALATGAAEVTKELVRDSYAALKALVKQWVGSRRGAPDPIAVAEAKPTARGEIATAVEESGVAQQQDIIDAAVDLLKQADKARPGIEGGIVGQINAAGGKVLVVVTNTGTIKM